MRQRADKRLGISFLQGVALAILTPVVIFYIIWLFNEIAHELGWSLWDFGDYYSSVDVLDQIALAMVALNCLVYAGVISYATRRKWIYFGLPWLLAALAEVLLCLLYYLDFNLASFPLLYTPFGGWIQLLVPAAFGLGYLYERAPDFKVVWRWAGAASLAVVVGLAVMVGVMHPGQWADPTRNLSGAQLKAAVNSFDYAPDFVGYPRGTGRLLRIQAVDVHRGSEVCGNVVDVVGPNNPAYYDVTLTSVGIFGLTQTTTLSRCQVNPL
ncbi:MAG TPA: hypothetical protein VHQ86_01255 [Candidatus Saccharimonadia bacterium]|jgi:hypothetical protein|nr:hypothetical protein [Candidatus Saccharimonadia bacterium]